MSAEPGPRCRKCRRTLDAVAGWLHRVGFNRLLGMQLWECRPSCDGPKLSRAEAIAAAIRSNEP